MSGTLRALVDIISSGVQTLESSCSKEGIPFPSLDDPFQPTVLDGDIVMKESTRLIVAAAAQLIATVRGPMETIQDYVPGMYMSAALGFVVNINVVNILKDAGPQGLHAKVIGTRSGVDGSIIARVLRYLATRHVFREVTANVFANNRISSLLVKKKTLDEIKSDPLSEYEGAPAAAFVGHVSDEGLKSSVYLSSFLENRQTAISPFNMAMGKTCNLWEWFEEPENDWRGRRFAVAMKGGGERFPPEIFTTGLDWAALKPEEVVVDVGGSVGPVTMIIAKSFPHLRYVVQDLDKVIIDANRYWEKQFPEVIANGRVKLQAHDFFQPQPIKGAAVYFMRRVIHDWAEEEIQKVLKNIRAAASPTSKLLVFDSIIPHACRETGPLSDIGGMPIAPPPLLSNFGVGLGGYVTMVDLQMLNLFNGQERTLEEYTELGNATGWKLESVKSGALATFVFSAA